MADETIETVKIAAEEQGQRLDRVLAARIPALSRSRLKALILDGQVTIQGAIEARTIRDPATYVNSGDTVTVTLPAPEQAKPAGEPIPLTIVSEDAALIVIDKPKGLVVHPAAGHAKGTLVNALIAHCGDSLSGIGGVKRPGIVHRLDKDTTGLMVVAKTDAAHRALSAQFANKSESGIERGYLALVWGAPARPKGTIDAPLDRHPHARDKRAVRAGGRQARRQGAARGGGAGSRGRRRRQAGRQPAGLHLGDRPHPPDKGAFGPYRASDPGRRQLQHRLQDQGQPAFPRRPRRPGRSWKAGPACLSTGHRTPHYRRRSAVPFGTSERSRSFTSCPCGKPFGRTQTF